MGGWWATNLWDQNPVLLVGWVVWLIGSITLHELAHGWAAIRCGDRTPIETGHMTWNPIVHMGTASIIMFALVGVAFGRMPVSPHRFRGRYDDAIVAGAGPAMNLGLAILCLIAYIVWTTIVRIANVGEPFASNFATFLRLGGALNIALIVLNMLPVPPLDGSRILANFDAGYARLINHPNAMTIGFVAVIALIVFGSQYLWMIAFGAFDAVAALAAVI